MFKIAEGITMGIIGDEGTKKKKRNRLHMYADFPPMPR